MCVCVLYGGYVGTCAGGLYSGRADARERGWEGSAKQQEPHISKRGCWESPCVKTDSDIARGC